MNASQNNENSSLSLAARLRRIGGSLPGVGAPSPTDVPLMKHATFRSISAARIFAFAATALRFERKTGALDLAIIFERRARRQAAAVFTQNLVCRRTGP